MRPPALIDAALHRGYDFAVFASAKLTSPEFDRTVFASIRDRIPLETPGESVVARDQEITRRFLDFLDNRAASSPFFGVLFYDSPHGYAFPEDQEPIFTPMEETIDYMALTAESDPLPIMNRLKTSYHFIDEEVGRVLDALERTGRLDDTVVIVTSDHGEEVNDTGENYWGHNGNFSPVQLRVPLAIRWPGRESRRYAHRTSHADVAPTLLTGLFGVENAPAALGNGRLLTDESPRPAIIAASWESYAAIAGERIDVVLPAAGIESRRASDYGEWTGPPPDRAELVTAMEELSRFYRR